ncbi:MAG TPA: ABC transporter ATP-binding protein [Mycobacteriales bacterium]|nr:ABC transporter ATP-binding protein [Mycobacteriales bacterium]
MTTASPLLRLDGVSRSVRLPDDSDLSILTDVTLDVAEGEHVAIVGRSGSGKSTLLNILGLLDTPTSGSYTIDGADAASLSARRRGQMRGRTFGFVFQQFNLLPRRTATENVAAPLMYARGAEFWQRTRRARAALDQVGLGHRAETLPERLSGGEQQRVAIARALVRSPRVLLADEPTGSLDVDTGAAVMDLLEDVTAGTGSTLVTITHDLSVAARAGRQFRLEKGRLEPLSPGDLELLTAHRGTAAARAVGATR